MQVANARLYLLRFRCRIQKKTHYPALQNWITFFTLVVLCQIISKKGFFYLFSFFISTCSVLQQLIVFSNILFSKLKKVCSKKCANSQATLLQGYYREHTFCSKKSYLKKRNFAKIMKFLWFLSFPKVPLPLIQENDCINDTHERAQKEEKLNVLYLSLPRYLL